MALIGGGDTGLAAETGLTLPGARFVVARGAFEAPFDCWGPVTDPGANNGGLPWMDGAGVPKLAFLEPRVCTVSASRGGEATRRLLAGGGDTPPALKGSYSVAAAHSSSASGEGASEL